MDWRHSLCPASIAAFLIAGCGLFGERGEGDDFGVGTDAAATGTLADEPTRPKIPSGVEAAGDLWLIQVEIPGFDSLDKEAKLVALHHSRAAWAGDPILMQQVDAELSLVRRMLIGVLNQGQRVPSAIFAQLRTYAAQFFAHHGNIDMRTGRGIAPRFIPGQLAAAAQIAVQDGADIGLSDLTDVDLGASRLEQLEALMTQVRPLIFGRRQATADAGGGEDAGVEDVPAGAWKRVTYHLRAARQHQRGADRDRASAAITLLERGEANAAARLGPLGRSSGVVHTIIGTESGADDPCAVSEPFGAIVAFDDSNVTVLLTALHKVAAELDGAIATDIGASKAKGRLTPSRVRAVRVVAATGWYGPILPLGGGAPAAIAEPIVRAPDRRELLLLVNVAAAADRAVGRRLTDAFSPSAEIADRRFRWRGQSRLAHLALREIVGRGTDGTEGRPLDFLRNRLGDQRFVIEELRADLTALYLAFQPQVRELGLVPDLDCARAMYDDYIGRALEQLVHLDKGVVLKNPRMQAVQIVVRSLIEKGLVIEERSSERLTLRIPDYDAMRGGIGELLASVRLLRRRGDGVLATELTERLGTRPPPEWTTEANRCWGRAQLPLNIGFIYPTLNPVVTDKGAVTDVEVVASDSLLDALISIITTGSQNNSR